MGTQRPGVLVIYTGGTIGSAPRDPDPGSPQYVVSWELLRKATPEIDRLQYEVKVFDKIPALDSCNVGPEEWKKMAKAIEANYDAYAGFVVLHGTDTMVYTACALSFMLLDLGKPVVITGAQRSALVSVRNDATQNFLTSLVIANPEANNLPVVPEVCIFFGGKLLRGNRAMKIDTYGYDAYDTPNLEPLGIAGDRIVINERLVRPLPPAGRKFRVRTNLDTHVMPLFIFPGIQDTKIAEAQLTTEGVRAAVVQSFGSGNIPTKPEFLDIFREARKRGIILADVSQCPRGPVELGIYETSAELLEAGFVAANDISVEAAQCKLMALLGDPDISVDEAELAFQQSLAGEQSISLWVTRYGENSGGRVASDAPRHRIRGVPVEGQWDPLRIERALLRLHGARVRAAQRELQPVGAAATSRDAYRVAPVEPVDEPPEVEEDDGGASVAFRVFLNLEPSADPDERDPSFAGAYSKWPKGEKGALMFDVTHAFRAISRAGDRTSFTLFIDTPGASLEWDWADLAVFVKEA